MQMKSLNFFHPLTPGSIDSNRTCWAGQVKQQVCLCTGRGCKSCLSSTPVPARTYLCNRSFVARLSNGRKLVPVLVLLRLRSSGRRGSV